MDPVLLLLLTTLLQATTPLPLLLSDDQKQTGPEFRVASQESIGCDACKLAIKALQILFTESASEDAIASAIVELCKALKIEDDNVCSLVIPEFKDEVLYVFGHVVLDPKEFCGIALGPDCGKSYDPYHQKWNVTLPNTPKPPVQPIIPTIGPRIHRILHLSDVHLDRLYTPGLSNDCGEPLCCRPPNEKGNATTSAGYWGDYKCDVPVWMLENLLQHLASKSDEFDWVYWTGDLPAHNVWNQTREDQLDILTKCVDLMHKYLPNKTVFPSLGNHESAPVNSFPPPFITGVYSNSWLLDAAASEWGLWLDSDTKSTIQKGGFYSMLVPGTESLRVISLQTNYCNNMNWWLLINDTDPAGQLKWLIDELQKAEDKGEKVHIIGHIPPGHGDCTTAWSWSYHKILNRYESTVVGQFFGHSHKDELEVFYDEYNVSRPTGFAMIGPSVTTFTDVNPGYRIYRIDGDPKRATYAMFDFAAYYMNLTDANLSNKPQWLLEYNSTMDYGMEHSFPEDFDDLVKRFKTDDNLFQKYYQYYSRKHSPNHYCDAACKSSMICAIVTSRSGDESLCTK